MNNFMMDLETRGYVPGCQILSIGLIGMNLDAQTVDDLFEDEGYYAVVSKQSCEDALLHEDSSTMAWWRNQSLEAREVLAQSEDPLQSMPLSDAMAGAVRYVQGHCTPRNALVWGNGADFDNPIANVAGYNIRQEFPWKWGNRCYRTVKNLHEILGISKLPSLSGRQGTYHNALADAKSQAVHMWDVVQTLRDLIR